jgi:signal peptidase I
LPPSLVASIALGGFLAVVLALYIAFSFNYQTIHALGPSMEPAVSNNDYLLLSKTAYRTGAPERATSSFSTPATARPTPTSNE